jgi:hypothetical protein
LSSITRISFFIVRGPFSVFGRLVDFGDFGTSAGLGKRGRRSPPLARGAGFRRETSGEPGDPRGWPRVTPGITGIAGTPKNRDAPIFSDAKKNKETFRTKIGKTKKSSSDAKSFKTSSESKKAETVNNRRPKQNEKRSGGKNE